MEYTITKEEFELLRHIERIIEGGNRAEVEKGRDGVSVAEIDRQKVYPMNA